jgi:hypothetical protein
MADHYEYNTHIIPTPNFITYIQVLIILLSTAVIGLTAYPLTFSDGDQGNGFLNFVVSILPLLLYPSSHCQC